MLVLLFAGELAGAPAAEHGPPPGLHTDPACRSEPRIVQTGPPAPEYRDRVKVSWRRLPAPTTEGALSPNRAYRWWARNPSINDMPPRTATLLVDVERDDLLWIELDDVAAPIAPTWVNEKLLFVRAWWSRLLGIDLLIDVGTATLLYQEQIEARSEACAAPGEPATDPP